MKQLKVLLNAARIVSATWISCSVFMQQNISLRLDALVDRMKNYWIDCEQHSRITSPVENGDGFDLSHK